jgi:hypothetical protein
LVHVISVVIHYKQGEEHCKHCVDAGLEYKPSGQKFKHVVPPNCCKEPLSVHYEQYEAHFLR